MSGPEDTREDWESAAREALRQAIHKLDTASGWIGVDDAGIASELAQTADECRAVLRSTSSSESA